MDVSTIQNSIQSSEQYKIRKQTEAQQAEQVSQAQAEQQAAQVPEVDEYDKANPVGEEVEGIYSVSHDEEGNLKVDYKQPEAKAENSQPAQSASAPVTTSSDDDDELEELEQQRDALKQQLNHETDEATKAQLRTQLQSIETQIALKSANL